MQENGDNAADAAQPPRLYETNVTAHPWFEMARLANQTPGNCNPLTHNLTDYLDYWHANAIATSVQYAVEKAIRYLAPATKAIFLEATSMTLLQHKRDDWNLFESTCRRTFQVTRSDIVTHPLRDANWDLVVRANQQTNTPRNQILRIQCNLARKPLKNLSRMVFGTVEDTNRLRPAQYIKCDTWLHGMKLLPDNMDALGNNAQIDAENRRFVMIGMAWALNVQAIQAFKFHNLPAQTLEQFNDVLQKECDMAPNSNTDLIEGLVETLATHLTTQANITGPSNADLRAKKSRPVMALCSEETQQEYEAAAIRQHNPQGQSKKKNKRRKKKKQPLAAVSEDQDAAPPQPTPAQW